MEVENHVNLIQDQSPQQHYPRSASFLLPLDSVNVGKKANMFLCDPFDLCQSTRLKFISYPIECPAAEKHQLSTQLYHSHRWLDKLHEFSSVSSTILAQNTTRRSASTASQGGRDVATGPLAAKRLKLKGPTSQQVSGCWGGASE